MAVADSQVGAVAVADSQVSAVAVANSQVGAVAAATIVSIPNLLLADRRRTAADVGRYLPLLPWGTQGFNIGDIKKYYADTKHHELFDENGCSRGEEGNHEKRHGHFRDR